MAHCNGAENVDTALGCGVDSIEHGYFIGAEHLVEMSALRVIWTPTFAPLANYLAAGVTSPGQQSVLRRTLAAHAENLRLAVESGVLVAVGSDAGASFVPHGQGAEDELECFVRAGIEREAALRLMNENGALALGI